MRRTGFLLGALVCLAVAGTLPSVAGAVVSVAPCGTHGVFGSASGTDTCTYAAGVTDNFNVPAGITQVSITAVGGKGGNGDIFTAFGTGTGTGGFGASVTDPTVAVTPQTQLSIAVGGNGGNGGNNSAGAAGANGGGAGGLPDSGGSRGGAGGGGGSSVYASTTALVVAGGGGGGGGQNGAGGAAGQAGGSNGCGGNPGTSNAPGTGGSTACAGDVGGDGSGSQGGAGGASDNAGGGGGGGGLFGGGGGGGAGNGGDDGGGGGSSFAVDAGATIGTDSTGTPVITITWTLPTPTLDTTVNDFSTSTAWSGSEVTGAQAYDTASFDSNSLVTGETPTGTVYYDFFTNGTCTGQSASHEIDQITPGQPLPTSGGTDNLAPGSYSFQASYSGDSNYHSATGACEPFTVDQATPVLDTTVFDNVTHNPWAGTEVTDAKAYDTATVTGAAGFTPTGSVEYSLFNNDLCENSATTTDTVQLSSGSAPNSTPTAQLSDGSYSFIADYSGDANYTPVAGTCEAFSVNEAPAPDNTVHPKISGTAQDGRTLTTTHGSWNSPEPLTYTYHWSLCSPTGPSCANIAGATHSTLKLTPADVGHKIGVLVTARDQNGLTGGASATEAGPVAKPKAPKSTAVPVIGGTTQVGHALTTGNGTWSSPDRLTYTYQWSLCSSTGTACAKITGATHRSLSLTRADRGHKLSVTVTATDQEHQSGHAAAKAAGPVRQAG
jgi:hypothetical protein